MVKPKLGVVYHYKDEEGLGDAVRKEYKGPFVIARDLMTINVGKAVTWNQGSAAQHPRMMRSNANEFRAGESRIPGYHKP